MKQKLRYSLTLLLATALIFALSSPALSKYRYNKKPKSISQELPVREFDGVSNDLRTGGVGAAGIQNLSGTLATFDDGPKTADEARTISIVKNYYNIMDVDTPGGYGVLWGPTVGRMHPDDNDPEGKLAGKEYWAYIDNFTGTENVRVVVQIPVTFNPSDPCILAGPSSGSRGVFGASGSTGEAGLKRGCVIAYTDKGTGTGVHVLYDGDSGDPDNHDDDTVYELDLTASTVSAAGWEADFFVEDVDLSHFPHDYPVAFKHAHSQKNPEKDWGYYTIQAIKYAFYVLNLEENFGEKKGRKVLKTITPENTVVISTSWSNGGKAVLQSGEADRKGLIDGIVAVEPSVGLDRHKFTIKQGERTWGPKSVGWSLYDMHAYQNVYQTCANMAPSNAAAYLANFHQLGAIVPTFTVFYEIGKNRCDRLVELGLLEENDLTEEDGRYDDLGTQAQEKLNTYGGMLEEQNLFQPVLYTQGEEVMATYASTYGKFHVEDQLFGISFSQVEGSSAAVPRFPALYSSRDINVNMIGENLLGGASKMMKLINNNADIAGGGSRENYLSTNEGETSPDGNLTAALQYFKMSIPGLREWIKAGHWLTYKELRTFLRIQKGIRKTVLTGRLRGKPTILIQGRSDEVVHINHGSRAYYARYLQRGDDADKMAFLEIENGHHLEMFNARIPDYGTNSSYIHPYYDDAVGMMIDHLKNGIPLPGSQVVRAQKKGTGDITPDMFPEIQMTPGPDDAIVWDDATNTLIIPE
jgi:hydroxybutyrate-dimer hydrolase